VVRHFNSHETPVKPCLCPDRRYRWWCRRLEHCGPGHHLAPPMKATSRTPASDDLTSASHCVARGTLLDMLLSIVYILKDICRPAH
jgi:hypothetical protein